MWGGRFASEEDPCFEEFNRSLRFDRELLEFDIQGSLAYARALERAGVIRAGERKELEGGLHSILRDHRNNRRRVEKSRAEDVHSYVEQELEIRVGELARKIHTGRSRNDQVATDLRLYLRARYKSVESEINRLLTILADLAEKHTAVMLPGYTHLQHAQPILLAHFFLAYGEMFLRDRQRIWQAATRLEICPLGSGALSGTVYRVKRDILAHELGFAAASENSLDAVSDRDFVLDFLYFASVLMMHLSRLSEDLILYSSAEFGFVQMHDSVTSGSSLMPQKKNPDALELIRGKTGRVYGHLLAFLTTLKGLPTTYNKDLQEDKEGLFDASRTLINCLVMMRRVLETMRIDPVRLEEALAEGYLNATELADYLVAKKLPFREAHHLVGRIVMRAMELKLRLDQLTLADYRSFCPLFDKNLYACLNPRAAVARRQERGGTAPSAVRKALARFRKKIGD
jgi:argininosuccinate lyase/amino-acid N-acetyltransferase